MEKSDLLIHQYQTALDLYKHEDNLNWTKMNNLVITTIAFATGIGLSYIEKVKDGSNFFKYAIIMLFIVGFIVILGFVLTLFSGSNYLLDKKLMAYRIENELNRLINSEVKVDNNKDSISYRRFNIIIGGAKKTKSNSFYVLRYLPISILVCWSFAFIVYLFKI